MQTRFGGGRASPLGSPSLSPSGSLEAFSMVSRRRRNQITLDSIGDPDVKLKHQLKQLGRDITDNVLISHRRYQDVSEQVMKKKQVTTEKMLKIEASYKDVEKKLDHIKDNAFWNKTNTQQRSALIKDFHLKRV